MNASCGVPEACRIAGQSTAWSSARLRHASTSGGVPVIECVLSVVGANSGGVQEAAQAEQRVAVRQALEEGLQEARSQRQWQDSAQGEAVAMVNSFARGQTHAPHGAALHALLDLGFPVTPDGAALLLKRIGYWPRNFPNAVVRRPAPCRPRPSACPFLMCTPCLSVPASVGSAAQWALRCHNTARLAAMQAGTKRCSDLLRTCTCACMHAPKLR